MKGKDAATYICLEATRGSLEDMCRFYFGDFGKSVEKAKRGELEEVAYIILTQNIDPAGIYEILAGSRLLKGPLYASQTIKWIRKNTICSWADELDFPELKNAIHEKVWLRQVAVRKI